MGIMDIRREGVLLRAIYFIVTKCLAVKILIFGKNDIN